MFHNKTDYDRVVKRILSILIGIFLTSSNIGQKFNEGVFLAREKLLNSLLLKSKSMIMRLILILQKLFLNFIPDARLFVEYARKESQFNYGEPFKMRVVIQIVYVLAIDFRKVIQRQNKNFQTLRDSLIYYNRFRSRTLNLLNKFDMKQDLISSREDADEEIHSIMKNILKKISNLIFEEYDERIKLAVITISEQNLYREINEQIRFN
ncbi:unnamed protein product [Paramecium pentaurelia]|uniref:Uncharacterized protein n=1 Tax=Paramecium pentaurelia TaxID=43138 RepID=A0A8S1XMR3_9CILI|nr:unnamed protein product [Paramecium pentaurelia]